jgi:hypothetical protein
LFVIQQVIADHSILAREVRNALHGQWRASKQWVKARGPSERKADAAAWRSRRTGVLFSFPTAEGAMVERGAEG